MQIFKRGELKLLWPFYLDALISPMLFFMPIFIIVYFRDLGFSLFQISILTSMMPLFMLLFEIPTGAFADVYGRKKSVLLGAVIQGIAITSIFFLKDYFALLFSFALLGIGTTFNSGAREAWIVDLIKSKKIVQLHDFFVKTSSLDSFGLVVSGLIGAFLVKNFGLSIIWIVAGLSFFMTLAILSFAEEKYVKKRVQIKKLFSNLFRKSVDALNYSRKHHVLKHFLIAMSILTVANVFNGDLGWIKFLQELGLKDYFFGYLWSLMALGGVFAPLLASKLIKKNKERKFLIEMLILSIILTALIIFVSQAIFAALILIAAVFLWRMIAPAERVYFHRFIPTKSRATIGSLESMLMSIMGLIALPIVGLSVDIMGAQLTIFIGALLTIPAVISYWTIEEDKEKF